MISASPTALELARRVLAIEADSVRALIDRLDDRFLAAVSLILGRRGRVVVSGIGNITSEKQVKGRGSQLLKKNT